MQLGGALVEARPPAEAAAAVAAVTHVLGGALLSHHWCDTLHGCPQARDALCAPDRWLYTPQCNSHCKGRLHRRMVWLRLLGCAQPGLCDIARVPCWQIEACYRARGMGMQYPVELWRTAPLGD